MLQPSELRKPLKVSHGMFLTPDILRQFFTSFAPGEDKYRLFYWVMLETGLRLKENCAIQENDFTENYENLTAVTCKNPKVRKIKLSKMLAYCIKKWCEFNRRRFLNGYIWPVNNHKYQHLMPFQAQNFMQKKRKQIGLDIPVRKVFYKNKPNGFGLKEQNYYALSAHSFRRFYETQLCNLSGGNYILIASIMQYDDPGIVRRYYDDSQAVSMQEVLATQYHDRITSRLVENKPLLPKAQKTLRRFTDEKEPQAVWAVLQNYNT